MKLRQLLTLAAFVGATCYPIGAAQQLRADDEWESNSQYYEDDAWYDVSEWFDGNDYNPTEESVGVWDNETWDANSETGVDFDSDWDYQTSDYDTYDYDDPYTYDTEDYYTDNSYYDYNYDYDDPYVYDSGDYYDAVTDTNSSDYDYDDPYTYDSGDYYADASDYSYGYGYNSLYDSDDWFYDYYDDGYTYYSDFDNDGLYDYNYRYYDWDNDGFYDAYSTYSDWDNDGIFDDYNYYSLNDVGGSDQSRQKAQEQAFKQGTDQRISGDVQQVKRVSTKDSRHLLVQVERQNGQALFVDLGPANKLSNFDISEGDRISVRGPISKVGQKQLMIAQELRANNQSTQIERDRRKFTGQVDGVRTIDSRGQKNRLVSLSTDAGKRMLVDLGPASQLDADLSQGDKVTISGPMAKVKDQKVVLAQLLTHNGEEFEIDRRQQSDSSDQTAAN